MREILFRGKTACGAWVQGDLIHRKIWHSEFEVIRVDDSGFDNYTEYEVATGTIGQYTGLTDKNGKKIFEGDIVICHHKTYLDEWNVIDGIDKKGVVCFKHGCFIMLDDYKYEKSGGKFLVSSKYENYEVIGNLYDNPKLLEVK